MPSKSCYNLSPPRDDLMDDVDSGVQSSPKGQEKFLFATQMGETLLLLASLSSACQEVSVARNKYGKHELNVPRVLAGSPNHSSNA